MTIKIGHLDQLCITCPIDPDQRIGLNAPASRLEHGRVGRHSEACQGIVHRGHDDGRGEELAKRRPLGALVFLGRQERFQLLANGLPAVLETAGDRIGEDGYGDRAEAAEPGKYVPFIGSGPPMLGFQGFQRADGREDVAGLGLLAGRGEKRREVAGRRWGAVQRR